MSRFQTSFDVLCEVSILHVYHKIVQQRIIFGGVNFHTLASGSTNQLGGGGVVGDPDNSPLTGKSTKLLSSTTYFVIFLYGIIEILL